MASGSSRKCSILKSGNSWGFQPDSDQPKAVFAPGTTAIPEDVGVKVSGDHASARVGPWEFQFGPHTMRDPGCQTRLACFSAVLNTEGQSTYEAVPADPKESKFEWTKP